MKWQVLIVKVTNGYMADFTDGEGKTTALYAEKSDLDSDKEHFVELLWDLCEFFAEGGSKHDKKRIRITYEETAEPEK